MTPPLLQATSVVLGEGQVNSYQARLSMPTLYLPPRHTVTGPNTKEHEDRRLPGTLRKLESSEQKPSRMPSSGMTQIFKASLVSLRMLEPKSWFSLRDSKSPAASRMWLWLSTLHPFSGEIFQGWHVKINSHSLPQESYLLIFSLSSFFFSQSGSTFSYR